MKNQQELADATFAQHCSQLEGAARLGSHWIDACVAYHRSTPGGDGAEKISEAIAVGMKSWGHLHKSMLLLCISSEMAAATAPTKSAAHELV